MIGDKKHIELIDHVRQSLHEYEEPYSQGAWETFQQHQNKNSGTSVGKVALSVAASLLFLVSVLVVISYYEFTSPDMSFAEYEQQGKNKPITTLKAEEERERLSGQAESTTDPQQEEMQDDIPQVQENTEPKDEPMAVSTVVSSPVASKGRRELNPVLINEEVPPGSGNLQLAATYSYNDTFAKSAPVKQNPSVPRVDKRPGGQGKNILFGLTYAPLLNGNGTGTEWSMGGGLYTEWNFARDLTLASGVLLAQNQLEFDQESQVRTVESEQITDAYVQVDLLSMEIPLNLQYSLTDNFSVSAGISSAAYLKEQYDYTYEIQREIQVMTFEESTGYEPVTTTVTFTESDQQSESSFSAFDWAGFYTFSVSYKHDLSGKHSLTVEPFMKLPSGPLTSRDLKYYTGGLQMKISF